jgi:uncharacterized protein
MDARNQVPPGTFGKLEVISADPRGVRLKNGEQEVLLPSHEVTGTEKEGEEIEVFVYTNEQSLQFATYNKPLGVLGEVVLMQVVTVTPNGAFAKWNVPVDLFIPKSDLRFEPIKGRSYLVGIRYNVRSGKLFGSTRLEDFIGRYPTIHRRGDKVEAVVAGHEPDVKRVIIGHKWWGFVDATEIHTRLSIGDKIQLFVVKREPSLLRLSPHNPEGTSADEDTRKVMDFLESTGGYARLTDDSPPEEISLRLKMSKKAFKRAIGMLYKSGHITLTPRGIKKNAVVTPPPPYVPKETDERKRTSPKKTLVKAAKSDTPVSPKTLKRIKKDDRPAVSRKKPRL